MQVSNSRLPMERSDIEKYIEDPEHRHEILKKYETMEYRKKVSDDKLNWLK